MKVNILNLTLAMSAIYSYYIINKDKLRKCTKYEGGSLKEGLWEAMQIENKINIKNYGIEIL
ncbi:hypothetical protein [Clostridium felsineum]|uniref:hypothetical protein n=1 Tax=Clostridium felsineum TaxID=36839 RepID=UPI00098C1227|nr:hypothetical protein [Clostridium felsineum]URZ02611.1 hypothetical protein CLAUR_026230 [Clostridium felsineum]